MDRLKHVCESIGILFRRNTTNANEIDVFINGYNIQLKTSTSRKGSNYRFAFVRRTDGGVRPYNTNDRVDFFLFEIADPRYQGNFFVVPKKVFVDAKYISTPNRIGKYGISIPAPIYAQHHWSLPFLNRFDQLNISPIAQLILSNNFTSSTNSSSSTNFTPSINSIPSTISTSTPSTISTSSVSSTSNTTSSIPLIFNNLHKICLEKGLHCDFDKGKLQSINSIKVKQIGSVTHNQSSYVFKLRFKKNKQEFRVHVNDGYVFLIFEFSDLGHYCIIPVSVLVERGYIVTDTSEGKISISIPFPGSNKNAWTEYYMDNFEQFRSITTNILN